MPDTVLSPQRRVNSLDALDSGSVDVVVIGGGITGVGCALDAATRGLSVALIEQRDLASGTSSRSSKLIHGGLRYLEQLNFKLVFEALQERSLLIDFLAPHLVHPVSFLYPLEHRLWERAYVGAGIGLYDLLAQRGDNPLPHHRHLSRRGVAAVAPGLDPRSYVGAVMYWDAQVDDARHTMAVARTAAGHGAHILTSTRVTNMTRDGSQVTGVIATCLETGREINISSSVVINATGVWSNDISDQLGGRGPSVRASKGVHLVIPRDRLDAGTGVILRTEKSVLFIIPWSNHWIIGTTDTDWSLDRAHPAASLTDIENILSRVNAAVTKPIGLGDIQGVYAGLRPLLSGESDDISKLSREHAVSRPAPGMISIAGGKYTTYRVMAADAVDAATREIQRPVAPSTTRHVPLIGATGHQAWLNRADIIAAEVGISAVSVKHLVSRFGSEVTPLLDLIADDPVMGEPLAVGHDYLRAEIIHAAQAEGALHLDDLLTRRTRLSIESWDRATDAAPLTASLVAPTLGWDEQDIARELWHYQARVDAELDSQTKLDDDTADAARKGAPDVRQGLG